MRCVQCWGESPDQKGYWSNVCDGCSKSSKENQIGMPGLVNKVTLRDYGKESTKRLAEMDRRVILPDEHPDGGYYLGRRGENGKIQDKEPTY